MEEAVEGRFERAGHVSLWITTADLGRIPAGYLEGTDELLAWLYVEFGVAIDGAFSTSYTPDGKPASIGAVLAPLHGSAGFERAAVAEAKRLGIDGASFAVGLYDLHYEPSDVGLPPACGSSFLRFLGAFRYG